MFALILYSLCPSRTIFVGLGFNWLLLPSCFLPLLKLDQELEILGDKAYVGLGKENVKTSMKRNEIRYKNDKTKGKEKNKALNKKRVKIEHIFANIKNYRILRYGNYYGFDKINTIFKAICQIKMLEKQS